MKYLLVAVLISLPTVTFAQNGSLQGLITGTLGFINVVLIPFILGIAFLIFIINAVRFFVIGGNNTESQENARNLALYGVGAFVLILSLWGMVNILANGIGLNEGPCIDGKAVQSDYLYGINSNAPCSSVRPQPRAHPRIDTVAPGNGFGQGIPGSVPPGGIVGDPNPVGPGVIIPGRDIRPTTPTPSPISFTPGGTPIISYDTVKTAQTTIKSSASSYFSSTINNDFGYNKEIVAPLFADLNKVTNDQIGEFQRLKAAVRLGEIGAIPKTLVANYITTYNTYAQSAGTNLGGPITLESLKLSLPTPIPATLISRRNQTRQQVIDALTASNVSTNTNHDVNSIVSNLYNINTAPEVRYKAVVSLYTPGTNGTPAIFNENVRSQALLFDRLLADINAEKIYTGDFNLGF